MLWSLLVILLSLVLGVLILIVRLYVCVIASIVIVVVGIILLIVYVWSVVHPLLVVILLMLSYCALVCIYLYLMRASVGCLWKRLCVDLVCGVVLAMNWCLYVVCMWSGVIVSLWYVQVWVGCCLVCDRRWALR